MGPFVEGKIACPVLWILICSTLLFSEPFTGFIPGESRFGINNYIEYIPGDLPIIISAPHGGNLSLEEIPDRTFGTTVTDAFTVPLTEAIYQELYTRLGRHPHVILCHLARTKIDANRSLYEGTEHPLAEMAWYNFHEFIDIAKRHAVEEFGAGLYIDIHGHANVLQRVELGYLLNSSDLRLSDEQIGSLAENSSLRELAKRTPFSFSELLRGEKSLGGLLEQRGFASVPSPQYPDPWYFPYFNGGYNTQRHGSVAGGTISGVQIECNMLGLRDTDSNRQRFAKALSGSIITYMKTHYGIDLGAENSVRKKEPLQYTDHSIKLHRTAGISRFSVSVYRPGNYTFSLYNIRGRVILSHAISALSPGTYNICVPEKTATGVSVAVLKEGCDQVVRKVVF
ncbi:N-formylglutamate amidohydrolase [Chitinispirillum alkaliphilum]|nr:N-formylglutamate amidohydrolase [Chitinispirillum alkaliphilum]